MLGDGWGWATVNTAGGTPARTEAWFIEGGQDSRLAHWDHEPGIPGGETPPSTAGGTPATTDDWFMESIWGSLEGKCDLALRWAVDCRMRGGA